MPSEHAATVRQLICRGHDGDTILAYAAENHWSETREQIGDLIEEAFTELAKHATEIDVDVEFGVAMIRLNRLFKKADDAGDTYAALAVQKEINKRLDLKLRNLKPRHTGQADGRTAPNQERPRLSIAK